MSDHQTSKLNAPIKFYISYVKFMSAKVINMIEKPFRKTVADIRQFKFRGILIRRRCFQAISRK